MNGLTVYVPPAFTRQGVVTVLDPEAYQKLNDAEVVLGVVGAGLTEACRQELNAGTALRKTMIVMSYPAFASQLQPYFGSNLVVIDPANPDGAEIGIVRHLKTLDVQQNAVGPVQADVVVADREAAHQTVETVKGLDRNSVGGVGADQVVA